VNQQTGPRRKRRQRGLLIRSTDLASQPEGAVRLPDRLPTSTIQSLLAVQKMSTKLRSGSVDYPTFSEEVRAGLEGAVLDWNWRTDYEADLAAPVVAVDNFGPHLIELIDPIPANLINHRLYLGAWPGNVEPLTITAVSDDGLEVQAKGALSRDYHPPGDWAVVGLPAPGPAGYEKLTLAELVWLASTIAQQIVAGTSQKKATASNGASPGQ